MTSLSSKSAQQISDLLDEYGIKHGPVVDSTRNLYEKKLKEAMAKGKRASYKSSPDKTYYREEEEEVTYVYRPPVRGEAAGGYGDRPHIYDKPSSYSSSYLKSTPMKSGQDTPKTTQSSRLIPLQGLAFSGDKRASTQLDPVQAVVVALIGALSIGKGEGDRWGECRQGLAHSAVGANQTQLEGTSRVLLQGGADLAS
ncbi:hypothetical protein INR49_022457 [Caranx melampygus]|nr:hypothetical protein INR49_022457 [Caranx melampygus]